MTLDATAQIQNNMVIDNNIWIYEDNEEGRLSYSGYYLNGDTLIEGKDYKVLYDIQVTKNEYDSWVIDRRPELGIAAFLREDNNKVYYRRITYRIDTVEGGGYQYPMYHYEMEYTVENKGETVETFQIVSTPLEGINCVYNHVDNGKNVSIPPMTSYTFTEHTTSTRLNNNICLAAYAPNGEPDIDFYDNISCFTPVLSATKAIPKVVASIHPNPVKHTLAIETESNLKTIIVRDMTGTPIGRYGHNYGYTLDVSGLTTGSYLLEIIDMEGRRSVLKFIKVL